MMDLFVPVLFDFFKDVNCSLGNTLVDPDSIFVHERRTIGRGAQDKFSCALVDFEIRALLQPVPFTKGFGKYDASEFVEGHFHLYWRMANGLAKSFKVSIS
jgi:hypothetical protein